MKPTVLISVTFVTAFAIGIGSMPLYHRLTPNEEQPSPVAGLSKAPTAQVDRESSIKSVANRQSSDTTPSISHVVAVDPSTLAMAVENYAGPPPTINVNAVDTNRVEASSVKLKLMKTDRQFEYWAWRVDVKNNTNEVVNVYVEIEWLDEDGFRVKYTNAVRKIAPGTHPITEEQWLTLGEAAKVDSVRVVKLIERAF